MINLELQKKNFENHVATLSDLGNIKVLDFKNPDSTDYRIRFIFEEDYCRCHISGDFGELVATGTNMTFEGFSNFVHNTDYFKEKINCHSRRIYEWNWSKLTDDLTEYLEEIDVVDEIVEDSAFDSEEDALRSFMADVLEDFSTESGLGCIGLGRLAKYDSEIYDSYDEYGRVETGILELYMLAFELATKQLKGNAHK